MGNILYYLRWRFIGAIVSYFRFFFRISQFITHILGVKLLIRTLFWPWKRDISIKKTQGFDPGEWFKRHLFNLFSRIIGFILKSFTLIFWLLLEVFWITAMVVVLPIWYFSPLIVIVIVALSLIWESSNILGEEVNQYFKFSKAPPQIVSTVILASIAIVLLFIETRIARAKILERFFNPDPQNPKLKDPWFLSISSLFTTAPQELKEIWLKDNEMNNLLNSRHLSRDEFNEVINHEVKKQSLSYKKKCWWLPENIRSLRPITEDWFFGWTFTLNQFSNVISLKNKNSIARIHINELEILKNTLAEGSGVNIAIVGETGVGRKRLIENLAHDITNRNVPPAIMGKKIVEFHIDNLLSAAKDEEDKVFLLEKAFLEAITSGNIILYIPSLQNYLEPDLEEGQIGKTDISAILANYLENTSIQIITVATAEEIHQTLRNRSNLNKYFRLIKLDEPFLLEILPILLEKAEQLEQSQRVLISIEAVRRALEIGNRYLTESALPQKAISFLEEAVAYHRANNPQDYIVKAKEIESFASKKIGVLIGAPEEVEKEKLLNLEKEMAKKVIGQSEAIKAVSSALRRRRLDLSNPDRPAGCFLFLGPTGVGKTYTAEVLAQIYFEGEQRMARLDMSEYQDDESIVKLLGDSTGKIEGYFHKILSASPFNLILLDELEKASPDVHELLLQIMEEGIAKTGTGKRLNFRETIIIATSNAQALLITQLIKRKEPYENAKKKVLDKIQQDRIFSPEFLNRFNEIVIFNPLSKEDLVKISALALKSLKKRLESKNIIIVNDLAFQEKLAQKGFDPVFGARELRRVVEKQIEDAIAKDLLEGKIVKGKEFELPLEYLD